MRLKKLISGVLAGLTAISSIPFSSAGVIALAADAEKDVWDGTTDTSWYDSEETEFHISTPEELAGLAELVNDGKSMSGQTFVLDNNIYLNDVSKYEKWESVTPTNSWTPIGTSDTYYFSGIFDGSGFSIEGLYILGSKYQYSGLFGYTTESSEIKNVNTAYEYISNTYSTSECYVGGITAYSKGKIDNCIFNGTVTTYSSSSYYYSYGGGIAGYSTAEISNCTNSGTVTSSSSYDSYGGGITGCSTAKISNCTNNGNIFSLNEIRPSVPDSCYIHNSNKGGITGYSSAEISNCENNGNVSSSSSSYGTYSYSYGGGIAGSSIAKIINCKNSGNISSSSSYYYYSYAGGIVGKLSEATILNCYNIATVNGNNYSGGLVGYSNSITIKTSYNTTEVTGSDYVGGVVGYNNIGNMSVFEGSYSVGKIDVYSHNEETIVVIGSIY
ncbi:MAG: GLUG motif-containing protein, partial [Ruminococcus callidus]|nr:GLUG motif-containing protein [Ruminococcus callidus]